MPSEDRCDLGTAATSTAVTVATTIAHETSLGSQNLSKCAYSSTATWSDSCFDAWKAIPSTTGTTLYLPDGKSVEYRTASLSSAHRYGTKVRLMVGSSGGTTYIYKAYVVVTYGILKY